MSRIDERLYAPSSEREVNRLLDAIEQSLSSLAQPLGPNETATRVALAAEHGLSYVAALRERLAADFATAPTESSERCGECGHERRYSDNEAGICEHLGKRGEHSSVVCGCKCVFPATEPSTESAGECPVCLGSHHGYDAQGYAVSCPNGVVLDATPATPVAQPQADDLPMSVAQYQTAIRVIDMLDGWREKDTFAPEWESKDEMTQAVAAIISKHWEREANEDYRAKYESLKSKIAWHRDGVGPDVPVLQPRYDNLRAEVSRLNSEVAWLRKQIDNLNEEVRREAAAVLSARADAIGECVEAAENLKAVWKTSGRVDSVIAAGLIITALEQLKRSNATKEAKEEDRDSPGELSSSAELR